MIKMTAKEIKDLIKNCVVGEYPQKIMFDLLEENEKLKQWDKNKDTRNSRQTLYNLKKKL